MNVRYTRRAQRDLARTLDIIAKESPQGARMLCMLWSEPTGQSSDFRTACIVAGHANTMGLAVTPYPYIVYWIVDGSDAQIVHIRHAARRIWKDER